MIRHEALLFVHSRHKIRNFLFEVHAVFSFLRIAKRRFYALNGKISRYFKRIADASLSHESAEEGRCKNVSRAVKAFGYSLSKIREILAALGII